MNAVDKQRIPIPIEKSKFLIFFKNSPKISALKWLSFTEFVCLFLFYFLFLQCSNRLCFQHSRVKTNHRRVTKFGSGVYLDDVWVDLENQDHRSKVKVTRSKNRFPSNTLPGLLGSIFIHADRTICPTYIQIEPCTAVEHHQVHSNGALAPPPMNKFARKLHDGYIVYLSYTFQWVVYWPIGTG